MQGCAGCRVLMHQFGVVKCIEPPQIFLFMSLAEPLLGYFNHIITEIARCVEFCHVRRW